MLKFVLAILALTSVLSIGMSKECNEGELRECLDDMYQSVNTHLHKVKNADVKLYCQSLSEKEGKCMSEASEACKKEHPKFSHLFSSFYAYLNHMCTDSGEIYKEILPCFEKHSSEFDACHSREEGKNDDPFLEICSSVKDLECVAKVTKKVCGKGTSFVKALEARIKNVNKEVCSGASKSSFYGYNYWILALTILILFVNTKKF